MFRAQRHRVDELVVVGPAIASGLNWSVAAWSHRGKLETVAAGWSRLESSAAGWSRCVCAWLVGLTARVCMISLSRASRFGAGFEILEN